MKRIFLFLATNIAILLVLSITLHLLGIERILDEQGVGLDLGRCSCLRPSSASAARLSRWPSRNGPPSGSPARR